MKTFIVPLRAAVVFAGLLSGTALVLAQDQGANPAKDAPKADGQPAATQPGTGMAGKMDPAEMKKMQEMHGKMMGGGEMAMGPKGDAGPSSQAYAAVNAKMHQDMAITYTGDADVDFVKVMIPHHHGAIETAKVVLKFGKDAETKKLAEEIIKAQEGEIAVMTAWLKSKGK